MKNSYNIDYPLGWSFNKIPALSRLTPQFPRKPAFFFENLIKNAYIPIKHVYNKYANTGVIGLGVRLGLAACRFRSGMSYNLYRLRTWFFVGKNQSRGFLLTWHKASPPSLPIFTSLWACSSLSGGWDPRPITSVLDEEGGNK